MQLTTGRGARLERTTPASGLSGSLVRKPWLLYHAAHLISSYGRCKIDDALEEGSRPGGLGRSPASEFFRPGTALFLQWPPADLLCATPTLT